MTRQITKQTKLFISLCACLAAGQVVWAAGAGTGSGESVTVPDTIYVGGAAEVLDSYFEQNANAESVPVPAASGESAAEETAGESAAEVVLPEVTVPLPEKTEEELAAERAAEEDRAARCAAVDRYSSLGIALVDSYLNVREKPSTEAIIVGKMLSNNACEVLDVVSNSEGYWLEIQSGDVHGYVTADYVATGEDAREIGREVAKRRVVISTETLNVRSEPSEDSAIWTQADGDEQYDVVQQLDGWVEIELDTENGFVSSEYVDVRYTLTHAVPYTQEQIEAQQQQSLRGQIVEYALQYVGNPYVWGGESLTKGIDCSGFTMKVYQHFGIYMSHYSGSQASEGKRISENQLKPGDLIFYSKNGTINHVAMYIGSGQVVHAKSKSAGITITDYNYRTPVRFVSFLDD